MVAMVTNCSHVMPIKKVRYCDTSDCFQDIKPEIDTQTNIEMYSQNINLSAKFNDYEDIVTSYGSKQHRYE